MARDPFGAPTRKGGASPGRSAQPMSAADYERSPYDMAEDRGNAAKRGVSVSKWERSKEDKDIDATDMSGLAQPATRF